jgi:hypothetical protein
MEVSPVVALEIVEVLSKENNIKTIPLSFFDKYQLTLVFRLLKNHLDLKLFIDVLLKQKRITFFRSYLQLSVCPMGTTVNVVQY